MTSTEQHFQNPQVLDRQRRSLEFKLAGMSYRRIAEQTGVSAQQAYTDVQNALTEYIREPTEEVRQQEAARLDRLMMTHWPKALEGDHDALNAVLRIMDRRAKLLGVDQPQKVDLRALIMAVAGEEGVDPSEFLQDMDEIAGLLK